MAVGKGAFWRIVESIRKEEAISRAMVVDLATGSVLSNEGTHKNRVRMRKAMLCPKP